MLRFLIAAQRIQRVGELARLCGQPGVFAKPVQLLAALPSCALRGGIVAGEHLNAPRYLHGVGREQRHSALVHLGDGVGQQRSCLVKAPGLR